MYHLQISTIILEGRKKNDSENHHMDWNNSKILAKETDYIRRFLESFFIHFNNDAFNDKTNCFYPTAYYNLKF